MLATTTVYRLLGNAAAANECELAEKLSGIADRLARRLTTTKPTDENQLLTVDAAAKRLNVSEATVRDLIAYHSLKAVNIGTGKSKARWRITPADLDAFITSRKPEPPAPRQHRRGPSFARDYAGSV